MTTLFSKKDSMVLDTPVKSEYDNLESASCHSGPRAGIQRDNKLMPKAFRFAQSGRSMVEMLGVLAVVGVLSIGGIMGYSYGMDKYRANETINDVNLRAMDIMSQLTQGGEPNLNAWETTTSGGYSISLNSDEAPLNYYIKVEKVPYDVCHIISETMPETVVIEVDNDTEQCADGENTMYFSYAGFDAAKAGLNKTDDICETDTDCNECQICYDGLCANLVDETPCSKGMCENGVCLKSGGEPEFTQETCSVDADCGDVGCAGCNDGVCSFNSLSCTKNGQAGKCHNGLCEVGACTTNKDCKSNQYCRNTNASCTEEKGSMCSELDFHKYTISYTDEDGNDKTETWYVSNYNMNWFNNKNACEALGRKMVSDPNELIYNWNGKTDTPSPNNRLIALRNAVGVDFNIWTEKPYPTNPSCTFYCVRSNGSATAINRNVGNGHI